jgi:hypothetical protein
MTFRTYRPMFLTIGLMMTCAATGSGQAADPTVFPPPPVAPFVPPPEPALVNPPSSPPSAPSELPPLVLPPVNPQVPASILPHVRSPLVDPGEAKPARSPILPAADNTPFWTRLPQEEPPIPEEMHHGIISDFELLPFGLSTQVPSFIDQAAPTDVFRARGDAFFNMLRPDRAEYFWAKQGFLRDATQAQDAKGPPLRDWKINAQTVDLYVEARLAPDVSIFTNVPFRFTDPIFNEDKSGLSDVSAGLKWAFILEPTRAITAQVTGTFPTGLRQNGMGTGNYVVEPALLWQEVLFGRLTVFGEVKDSIPIMQRDNFAGNILTYGLGGSFMLAEVGHVRIMPTVEGVGWTIFGGAESPEFQAINEPLVQDSRGETIVNVNAGIRFTLGDSFADRGLFALSDLYIGYGHAVTGTRWYRDIYRIEYRLRF